MNTEDSIVKIEELKKTNSRLRNVGGYLLNKLTKQKSTATSKTSNLKKRKNFFSLFEREQKTLTNQISQINSQEIDQFDFLNSTSINEPAICLPMKALDNSIAKSKIKAAPPRRKCNPRTKLESIIESSKQDNNFDSIDMKQDIELKHDLSDQISSTYKSSESLNDLIEKTKLNLKNIKLSKNSFDFNQIHQSPAKLKIVENSFVKISNELNLYQEKSLSSEPYFNKKSSSRTNSELILMETNVIDSMHIYDNSTSLACHNYDINLSDISIYSPPIESVKTSNNELNINHENRNTIVELRSIFTNETKSSKSFEGLDKIHSTNRQENQQIHKTQINKSHDDELNKPKKYLTYSKSLKLNQAQGEATNIAKQGKPSKRIAVIINDLNNSSEPIWNNNIKRKSNNSEKDLTNDSLVRNFERGKVKSIVKGLEK